jgi:serine/threonine protein kinase
MSPQHRPTSDRDCPSHDELIAYSGGALPRDRLDAVRRHVAACPRCDAVLRDLITGQASRPASSTNRLPAMQTTAGPSEDRPAGPGPRRLGQYEIHEQLGRGGMGAVHRAWHVRLKRWVALKILPPERTRDPVAVARFLREMGAVGRLEHHPNVVRATDAGEQDGTHFLAMELVEGIDLSQLVRLRGPLAVPDACALIRQAALGLQYVHERKIVHRDVKPSNLMLTTAGEVKILDLGLALLQGDPHPAEELTGSGQVLGTAAYMAPEQWDDVHAVDVRADVYGLGCALYKLLAGRTPFSGSDSDSLAHVMQAHASRPVPPIERPDVPAALSGLLFRMLAKNPADRVATAAEVALALEPFARGADLPALANALPAAEATTAPPRAGALTTSHSPPVGRAATWSRGESPAPPAPPRPRSTRRRWLAATAAGTLLAALGAGAVLLRRRAPKTDDDGKEPAVSEPPLKPNVWNPLLGREPETLRWPPPPTNSYKDYRAAEQELRVHCQDLGLLKLGESKHARYKLAVTLHQNPWAGNVGLFFGHQTAQLPDGPAERYHFVELIRDREPRMDAATYFQVDWLFMQHLGPPGKQREVSERHQASRAFVLPARPHRLVLTVGPGGLETVTWGDATEKPLKLAEVIGPNSVPAPPAKAGSSHGAFGVYVRSGNGVFRDASYFYEEER